MMRIAVDCRLIGQSGIGTFIENVVCHIVDTPDIEFLLIGNKQALSAFGGHNNCKIVECCYGSFNWKELLLFPTKEVNRCDVFFTPNFNIPMGIKIPIYSTIHDIVFFDTEHFGSTIHMMALRWYIKRALRISKGIFTVSNFSRQRIQEHFHTKRDIKIVGNGLSKELLEYKNTHPVILHRSGIVYLGNIKRYKGIHVLWEAYKRLLDEGGEVPPLTIIGRFDFRTKDHEMLQTIEANKEKVRLVTDASNQQVYDILSKAQCLISPSLYEGFGIPPLEAMSLGTPVILSDIPVYREIYGSYPVTFFGAGNTDELYNMLKKLPSAPINVDPLIASTYTYGKTARMIMQALTGKSPDNG
jgi:glycosyltransferase involved in cell wall biosynthesis